jgi:DNA integrity scanning protein DisA with diadenylate cyclase activity
MAPGTGRGRHREDTDALVIVTSEERGEISIMVNRQAPSRYNKTVT